MSLSPQTPSCLPKRKKNRDENWVEIFLKSLFGNCSYFVVIYSNGCPLYDKEEKGNAFSLLLVEEVFVLSSLESETTKKVNIINKCYSLKGQSDTR